jgi:sugar lactone lactonase YvrE
VSGLALQPDGLQLALHVASSDLSALATPDSSLASAMYCLGRLAGPEAAHGTAPDILGETPVWCPVRKCVFWIDIRRHLLQAWERSGQLRQWTLPDIVGAVVLRQDASLVLALRDSLYAFDPDTAMLSPMLRLERDRVHNRLNDAKVDRCGHLWCGSMWDFGAGATGSLYQVRPDLHVTEVRTAITIPNAIAFSPDGRWMYFADTSLGAIERAPFQVGVGIVGAWEVLVPAGLVPGKPDGLTVDSEGGLWNARFGAGLVTRFHADGQVDRSVSLPASQPTSCAFGGDRLDQLYVTTARQRLTDVELAAQPLAGRLLVLDTSIRGLPEPRFRTA